MEVSGNLLPHILIFHIWRTIQSEKSMIFRLFTRVASCASHLLLATWVFILTLAPCARIRDNDSSDLYLPVMSVNT